MVLQLDKRHTRNVVDPACEKTRVEPQLARCAMQRKCKGNTTQLCQQSCGMYYFWNLEVEMYRPGMVGIEAQVAGMLPFCACT